MGLTGQSLKMEKEKKMTCDNCYKEIQLPQEGRIFDGIGEVWCQSCWDNLETSPNPLSLREELEVTELIFCGEKT